MATAVKPALVTLPAGAMIGTSDDPIETGLHRVVFEGKDLLACRRDIRERTQVLNTGRDTGGFEG
jgi:hypothetical protein